MNAILAASVELQDFLLEKGWPFCFIGGVAVLRWGQPRTTQDVDVSLFVEFGKEKQLIEAILGRFESRIGDAAQFAIESRVILAQSKNGIAYDILLAQFDFERAIIDRASNFEYANNTQLLTISAEDLVVLKAFAGRDQDWNDVQGIIIVNHDLNVEFIIRELSKLVSLQPGNPAIEKLNRFLDSN